MTLPVQFLRDPRLYSTQTLQLPSEDFGEPAEHIEDTTGVQLKIKIEAEVEVEVEITDRRVSRGRVFQAG